MDQQKNTGLCVKCEVKVSGLALVCLGVWCLKVVFFWWSEGDERFL